MSKYEGSVFISAGPTIWTRVCEKLCSTVDRTLWTRERCSGLRLLPKELVYPIEWGKFMLYLFPDNLEQVLELSKNSTIIHVWNDRSKKFWYKTGTNNAYQVIAEKNCPNVYKNCTYF